MVDICLALHYGASLIMCDHKLRCDARKLLDILFPRGEMSKVTIMQTTPSLFMRWPTNDIKHRVFSSHSQLRILAFGGEKFPAASTLYTWKDWESGLTIRIYNLYGLTEMSCWASVYEITRNDISATRKIPIGQPIDTYTTFEVSADGELLLKSTIRKCFQPQLTDTQVIDDGFEFILHTGDLVHMENDAFYFTSRTNAVIKFYGQKINLSDIEMCTKNVSNVDDVICVHDEKHHSIALFVKTNEDFDYVKGEVLKSLKKISVAVNVHCVSQFPLTAHGKVCKSNLLNSLILNDNEKSIQLTFQKLVNESIGTEIHLLDKFESVKSQKKLKTECDSSFIHLGGSSLKAIQIVDEFERITSQPNSYLLPMLLDERVSIRDILSRLRVEEEEIQNLVISKSHDTETNTGRIIPEIVPRWRIDMEKCIDATPTVCTLKDGEIIVSVGSHSKLLYNISVANGKIVSKLELPDRIESQVVQNGDYGIVGCYDGCLYCFEIRTGVMKWVFNSGAMIKCRVLLTTLSVLFGNYNESSNLWCLNAADGALLWSKKIGMKSIYANPVKMNDESCIICSLDGTVALVNHLTAKIVWTFDSKAPIFSTPTVFQNSHDQFHIIIAAVNGTIYNLNSAGVSIATYQIDGNVFSSFEHFSSSADGKCINFLFGSQNRYLYRIEIDETNNFKEVWRVKTAAPIRSIPIFIKREPQLCAAIFSSDGVVKIINCDNGQLIGQSKINGDVFSTPVIYNGQVFVGSRNNFLYCIDLNDLT